MTTEPQIQAAEELRKHLQERRAEQEKILAEHEATVANIQAETQAIGDRARELYDAHRNTNAVDFGYRTIAELEERYKAEDESAQRDAVDNAKGTEKAA